jgi:hypothetical protein
VSPRRNPSKVGQGRTVDLYHTPALQAYKVAVLIFGIELIMMLIAIKVKLADHANFFEDV